jgi:hypothetical protein
MKNFFSFFFFLTLSLFYSNLLSGQEPPFEFNTPIPNSYVTFKTSEAISIDGIVDESAWQRAPWTTPFIDIEGKKTPKYNTQMKMLWDEKYLYFMAKLEEPHVWGTLKQRDTVIFYNNDFEIFIDPDGDTHNYVEFEMNVLNTIWDLFLTAPYRNNPKALNQWDMKGVLSAVSIQGTLNNPSDVEQGWLLEVAIPWTVFKEVTQMDGDLAGKFWRMGFSRVNWDFDISEGQYYRKKGADGNYLPEYNWVWSEQKVINMHEPEKWGYVYFSPKTPGENDSFSIPDQEHLKWFMYQEYRKLLSLYKTGNELSVDQINTSAYIKGEEVKLRLMSYLNGFSLLCESPFSELTLEINTSGKFKSYETNSN